MTPEVRRPISARDRGLVFRSSTGAKVGDLFIPAEERLYAITGQRGGALVQFFYFFSYPAHAGDLDFAVLRNPKD